MDEIDVRIVELGPLHVAVAQGFGTSPEGIAWEKINAYIVKNSLASEEQTPRFFGFNNPDPSPGSPNYGYEQWVVVGSEAQPDSEIAIKDFEGGLYAVSTTTLAEIGENWQKLAAWREGSPYRFGSHQWLEEVLTWQPGESPAETTPEKVLIDLYLPIVK